MKKALSLFAIVVLSMGTVNAYAQEDMAATEEVVADSAVTETMDSADAAVDSAAATTDSAVTEEVAEEEVVVEESAPAEKAFTQILKEKFIEGWNLREEQGIEWLQDIYEQNIRPIDGF